MQYTDNFEIIEDQENLLLIADTRTGKKLFIGDLRPVFALGGHDPKMKAIVREMAAHGLLEHPVGFAAKTHPYAGMCLCVFNDNRVDISERMRVSELGVHVILKAAGEGCVVTDSYQNTEDEGVRDIVRQYKLAA